MLLVFGLGNPGDRYRGTRHNVGKEVLGSILRRLGLELRPGRGDFYRAHDPDRDIHLVVPTTYVNDSGIAASQALESLDARPAELLVLCDDFNLPLGCLRIRKRGSEGGHNGLSSIIYQLGTQDFPRLRMGVGPLPSGVDWADFVLARFTGEEADAAGKMKEEAVQAVLDIAGSGLDAAMNTYNRRIEP
ncbi:MAG: aminoacyl-tRNA hydrolase [bacterium]